MKDWKSTAAGILSFLITTLTTLSGFLVAGNLIGGGTSAASIHVSTWIVIGVNVALALCRAWVGLITQNADAGAVAQALAVPAGVTVPVPTAATLASAPTTKAVALLCVLGLLCVGLAGCSQFERTAFNTLSSSQAVIAQARKDYISGTIKNTTCTDALITNATSAHDAAVTALEVYAAEQAAGSDLSAQEATVTADVASVVAIVAEVKAIYSNPAGCKLP
jgi:hypothetical protein